MKYTKHVSAKKTSQKEAILGREDEMVKNNAGGMGFEVDDFTKLDRFLVLGSEGGTYYASERKQTKDAAKAVTRCLKQDGVRTVQRIVEISEGGRAPKNDPALFALALAISLGDPATRAAAGANLSRVARTGTHLFQFVNMVNDLRGWGRGLKRAVGEWYTEKPLEKIGYQVVKYRSREGMSHRDVLRMAHPKSASHNALFRYLIGGTPEARAVAGKKKSLEDVRLYGPVSETGLPEIVYQYEEMAKADSLAKVLNYIGRYPNLPWETIPTEFLKEASVWEALAANLPYTALIRNLGRMTANGALGPLSAVSKTVIAKLSNGEALRKARVHPIAVLAAMLTYQQGHGTKGSLTWKPVQKVVDALDDAFYAAFGNVEPTGKNLLLALDVSGSMGWGNIAAIPGLTPAMGAAAMALVTSRVEPNTHIFGFADTFRELKIQGKATLNTVMAATSHINFGGTDCSLPMLYAMKKKMDVDGFIVYTDNETWAGDIHPTQALKQYRQERGIEAREVVVGMTATDFTIADPKDRGQLDVVGFDTATPNLISGFVKGEF